MKIALSLLAAVTSAVAGPFSNEEKAGSKGPVPEHLATNLPPFQVVAPGIFSLGKVVLNKTNATVVFPATLNMASGPLEYLLVTTYGKVHESLLRTEVPPYQLHVAMLLLGAHDASTTDVPAGQPLPGDLVGVELSWKTGPQEQRLAAEDCIWDEGKKAKMTPGPWHYTGSQVVGSTFTAQRDGSMISLITDSHALVNNPRPGRDNDSNWSVNTNSAPPTNVVVEVTLRLLPVPKQP